MKRFTRRKMLGNTGKAVASLSLGASAAGSFLRPATAFAAAHYIRGYNDDFQTYTTYPNPGSPACSPAGPNHNDAFYLVKAGSGQIVRQAIDWRHVWNDSDPAALTFCQYEHLRTQAAANGLLVLPHITGCPSWADSEGKGYPDPAHVPHYGDLVKETLRYFGCPIAEVWNEPNISTTAAIPPDRFAAMVTAACDSRASDPETTNRGIIAGGLFAAINNSRPRVDPTNPQTPWQESWEVYLKAYEAAIPAGRSFAVGLHPYDLSKYEGLSSTVAADKVSTNVLKRFDEAKLATSRDIFITETGVSSDQPFGTGGQGRALGNIASGLRQRARCKSMIVHRLYPDNIAEPPGNAYHGMAVTSARFGQPQNAHGVLSYVWSV